MKKLVSKIVLALACVFAFVSVTKTANAAEKLNASSTNEVVPSKAARAANEYVLVTSTSQLVSGKKVIICGYDKNSNLVAMEDYTGSSRNYYYYGTSVELTTDGTDYFATSANATTFTVGKSGSQYTFFDNTNEGYLGAYYGLAPLNGVYSSYTNFTVTFNGQAVKMKASNGTVYISSSKFTSSTRTSSGAVFMFQEKDESTNPTPSTVAVTGVTLSKTSASLTKGNTLALTATVSPSNATNKSVTWASSNTSVATVNSNGVVTAVANGTATITVTTADGGFKATCTVTVSNVKVTGVSVTPTSATLEAGKTIALTATVTPSNAADKSVTWTSSNTNVATVSSTGVVTAKSQGSATITAKTNDGSYTATSKITVTATTTPDPEPQTGKAAWTIMIYMCGADLESQNSLATSDIQEILAVSNQPENVNIIIQTGGASKWNSKYGISASYAQRWHVANKKLVKDTNLTKSNMGAASTFQSFLEWGLTSYPADKTGVVMWNHGGAMRGVCYDEQFDDDSLLNSEVYSALTGAFTNTKQTSKLEFIGYDACLMAVQDVAEFNSNFFNYMISSEESESGYGWDYDTWVDDLYKKSSTTTILKAIVDGFIADNGGVSSSRNNQTLSYLNLSKMSAYKAAWEKMASAVYNKLTSSNKSSFKSLVNSCKHYGDSYYTYYGTFDAKDFINKLSSNSTFNPGTSIISELNTAFNNLVEYSSCGKGAGNSYGLCMFYSIESTCYKSTYYTASQTNFTNWRSLVNTYGA